MSIGSAAAAHGRVLSGMPGHVLLLKIAYSHGDLDPQLINASSGLPKSITQTASRLVQLFLYSSRQSPRAYRGMSFPLKIALRMRDLDLHLIRFLGPIRVHNQNGILISLAVFAHLTTKYCRRCRGISAASTGGVLVLYNGPSSLKQLPLPPQNCPFPLGIWTPI